MFTLTLGKEKKLLIHFYDTFLMMILIIVVLYTCTFIMIIGDSVLLFLHSRNGGFCSIFDDLSRSSKGEGGRKRGNFAVDLQNHFMEWKHFERKQVLSLDKFIPFSAIPSQGNRNCPSVCFNHFYFQFFIETGNKQSIMGNVSETYLNYITQLSNQCDLQCTINNLVDIP